MYYHRYALSLMYFTNRACAVSGRQFHKAVIKVPKAGGVEELKGEVEELGKLEREYTSNLLLLVISTSVF